MTMELPSSEKDDKDKLIGEVLANRYQIEQLLGEGAMGTVYRARHVKVGRPFAVKVLHRNLLEDRKVAQRFDREAELAGRLRHPNVIGVVDVGEIDTMRYMVMDFAEGADLATLLNEAPMPAERVMSLTRQLCEGLFHAHEQGLIHRDFKPENVIVERDDHGMEVPRIVDFGIAILREGGGSVNSAGRLTTNGLVLGTPHYMAPEQAVADPIDHRIDLFALGIVVYEMLCGKLPFDGTGAEVARANLLLDPPPIAKRVPYLEVDPLLEAFARRLMAKKREQRPATAKHARELLDLIDKDRAAAAAALGVPPAPRIPQITQPSAPARPDQTGLEDLEGPPATASAVIASASAPAFAALAAEPQRAQQYIATTQTDPITWEGKRLKNRKWLALALVGVFGVAAAITVVAVSNDKPKTPAAPVPEKVVMSVGSTEEPLPPDPVPDPGSNAIAEPGSDAAPPMDPDPGSIKPPDKRPKKDPRKDPKQDPKKDPKQDPKQAGSGTAVVEPQPPTKLGPDTNTVIAQYQAVGSDLKVLASKVGDSAVADLDQQYRNIQIHDAISTQPKRDQTARVLATIRREIKKRMPN
ncbi:MAG TPA: protein kinase [Kofleriaceae bacterium]